MRVPTSSTSRRRTTSAAWISTRRSARAARSLTYAPAVLASLTSSLTSYVRDHGLYAIFVLMLVDAMFPAASELVMVVGGALAAGAFGATVTLFGHEIAQGFPSYIAVSLAGTLGYLVGALIGWAIGIYGGRPLLERHGRWLHVGPTELARAEAWFDKYEGWAVFVGRLTPVVR